jgi:ABC-type glutathione transport system ATPase component
MPAPPVGAATDPPGERDFRLACSPVTAICTTEPSPVEPSDRPPVVQARSLTRDYGRGPAAVRAVDQVDLTVHAGEAVLVFGPSGCARGQALLVARRGWHAGGTSWGI